MENDGIQRLLKAEDEAAATIQRAKEQRTLKLRQAQSEAEKSAQTLKAKLEADFKDELSKMDTGDSTSASKLRAEADKEMKQIEDGFEGNKKEQIDLLLYYTTAVKLEVEEALKQSLITKHEQGQA